MDEYGADGGYHSMSIGCICLFFLLALLVVVASSSSFPFASLLRNN